MDWGHKQNMKIEGHQFQEINGHVFCYHLLLGKVDTFYHYETILLKSNCHSAVKSVSGKGENQERPGLPLAYCQLKVLPEVWV